MTVHASGTMILLTAALAAPASADLVGPTEHQAGPCCPAAGDVAPAEDSTAPLPAEAARLETLESLQVPQGDIGLHRPVPREAIADLLDRVDDSPLITRLVPEPASLALATLGVLLAAAPRRNGSHND